MPTVIEIVMLSVAAVMLVATRVPVDEVPKTSTLRASVVAVIGSRPREGDLLEAGMGAAGLRTLLRWGLGLALLAVFGACGGPASADDAPPPPRVLAPIEALFLPLRKEIEKLPPFLGDTDLSALFRTYYFDRTRPHGSESEAWAFGGWISYQSGWLAETFAMGTSFYGSAPLYAPEDKVALVLGVPPPRERDHPHDPGMAHEVGVQVVLLRQRQLEHDLLILAQCVELLPDGRSEQLLRLGLFRAVNVDFRLDDRHEVRGHDLPSDFELLGDDVLDARAVGLLDERAHLGSKDALCSRVIEQYGQLGHRLQQLDTAALGGQALVHLQKWHHPFMFHR